METVPSIVTDRTHLVLPAQPHAPMLLEYYKSNEKHLRAWEPERSENFYTLEHWFEFVRLTRTDFRAEASIKLIARIESKPSNSGF